MNKQWILIPILVMTGVLATLWLQEGCAGKYPPLSVMVVTPTPTLPPDVISNFENGSVTINSNLKNTYGYPGSWTANTYGGNPPNKLNSPILVPNTIPNADDSSLYALHVFGSLTTTAGTYEADQLLCNLITTNAPTYPYYDASSFIGIRFDLVVASDDTNAANRVLQIPIDQTTVTSTPGGICTSGCYDHLQVPLTASTSWAPVTHMWGDFAPGFGGTNIVPSGLANHLTKIINLQFVFSSNSGSAGVSTYTDFWVDNVQFLP